MQVAWSIGAVFPCFPGDGKLFEIDYFICFVLSIWNVIFPVNKKDPTYTHAHTETHHLSLVFIWYFTRAMLWKHFKWLQ